MTLIPPLTVDPDDIQNVINEINAKIRELKNNQEEKVMLHIECNNHGIIINKGGIITIKPSKERNPNHEIIKLSKDRNPKPKNETDRA
jgi:hypothetical protein